MLALEALLGFSPTVHIPQIKSETVFFMEKTFPTEWFTVSYNLTKMSSQTIIPLYKPSLLIVSGFEGHCTEGRRKPLKVRSEQPERCVWRKHPPVWEHTWWLKQTLLLMDAYSGVWDRHLQSPPRLQCANSFQGDPAGLIHRQSLQH